MEYIGVFNIGIISFILFGLIISYLIGYRNGFKKSKEIDDEIIDILIKKYKTENK